VECWLGDNDILRRDRAEPMIVLPWRVWALLLRLSARRYGRRRWPFCRPGMTDPRQTEPPSLRAGARAVVADVGPGGPGWRSMPSKARLSPSRSIRCGRSASPANWSRQHCRSLMQRETGLPAPRAQWHMVLL